MFDVGGAELLLILLAVVILFGPKKLPEVARMMGKGMLKVKEAQSQFQDQIRDIQNEIKAEDTQTYKTPLPTVPESDVVQAPTPEEVQDISKNVNPDNADISEETSQTPSPDIQPKDKLEELKTPTLKYGASSTENINNDAAKPPLSKPPNSIDI